MKGHSRLLLILILKKDSFLPNRDTLYSRHHLYIWNGCWERYLSSYVCISRPAKLLGTCQRDTKRQHLRSLLWAPGLLGPANCWLVGGNTKTNHPCKKICPAYLQRSIHFQCREFNFVIKWIRIYLINFYLLKIWC